MKVNYRRNGQNACYEYNSLHAMAREPPVKLVGPFPHCGGCPYPGHGFVCWGGERCMRQVLQQINEGRHQT